MGDSTGTSAAALTAASAGEVGGGGSEQRAAGDTTGGPTAARWPISLLWPEGKRAHTARPLTDSAATDLSLDVIIHALDLDHRHGRAIRAVLYDLCTDPATICYRQDILADLRALPALAAALEEILPYLADLGSASAANWPGDSPLGPVVARLRELERYVWCVDRLQAILQSEAELQSDGLRLLRDGVNALAADPEVSALRSQLPALQSLIGQASSVTIGLNLGQDLLPESATIVELNRAPFKGPRSLLGRLLPRSGDQVGLTPLHMAGAPPLRRDSQLFKDLQRLLEAVTAPLGRALVRYKEINVAPLAALEAELAFFLGAAALAHRLETAGIALCRPSMSPTLEQTCVVAGAANMALALQMLDLRKDAPLDGHVVASDVSFAAGTQILVVTGPNRGGKTTFCRAVGQAQVLFQSGLYVLGTSASMSPVHGIWTHFPLPETDRPGAGRLDEEVRRLRQIFDEARPESLILLNEPLTSTSERDALMIARDVVRALQALGARAVLITHLHDLALAIPQLNAGAPENRTIASLVAEAVVVGAGTRGTFRIVPGVPTGRSYAAAIAEQHGLTFHHLQQLLAERGFGADRQAP